MFLAQLFDLRNLIWAYIMQTATLHGYRSFT